MVNITKNVENKLLSRKEIEAVIPNENGTLSRAVIKKEIAKKLKVKEELVIVNNASNYFGNTEVRVKAKVYDTKESLEANARPHMIKRNHVEVPVVEEAAAPAAAPAAEEAAVEEA